MEAQAAGGYANEPDHQLRPNGVHIGMPSDRFADLY